MATIKFVDNNITFNADPAVTEINLDGKVFSNNTTTSKPESGDSEQVIMTYKSNPPPPNTFKVTSSVNFPENANVTITGGGENESTVEASDAVGNRAVWTLVGDDRKL